MNLEYKQKYLKYKNKYLSLKLELEGGKKPNFDTTYYLYKKKGASWLKGARDNPKDAIDDSKVKLPLLVADSGNEIFWDNWDHHTHATFEYLEKKYGGRFEKHGIFKKGGHLDKKGNYKTHKSGMFSHYPEYFGKLTTWEEDIKAGKKFFEEYDRMGPKLLEDNQSIFDNLDYYRANFINGSFMFDKASYHWIEKNNYKESKVLKAMALNHKNLIKARLGVKEPEMIVELEKIFKNVEKLKLVKAQRYFLSSYDLGLGGMIVYGRGYLNLFMDWKKQRRYFLNDIIN